MKRELWESVVDLVESISAAGAEANGLRIKEVTFEMPMTIVLRQTQVGFRFLADAPEWRLSSGLADQPGRVRMTVHEVSA
jgi:hypothetical protein